MPPRLFGHVAMDTNFRTAPTPRELQHPTRKARPSWLARKEKSTTTARSIDPFCRFGPPSSTAMWMISPGRLPLTALTFILVAAPLSWSPQAFARPGGLGDVISAIGVWGCSAQVEMSPLLSPRYDGAGRKWRLKELRSRHPSSFHPRSCLPRPRRHPSPRHWRSNLMFLPCLPREQRRRPCSWSLRPAFRMNRTARDPWRKRQGRSGRASEGVASWKTPEFAYATTLASRSLQERGPWIGWPSSFPYFRGSPISPRFPNSFSALRVGSRPLH
jgi:hypothetical protein